MPVMYGMQDTKQGARRTKNKSLEEEHEFRRARSSKTLKGDRGPKRRQVRKSGWLFSCLKSNICFLATARWLVQSWRRIDFLNAFLSKLVSFICNIEDLSALHAPLIDSFKIKRAAANNNSCSFFVSGLLPITVASHKPKMTSAVRGHTYIMLLPVFERRKCDAAHLTRSSANK